MIFIPWYEKKHLTGALDILWSSSFQPSPKGRIDFWPPRQHVNIWSWKYCLWFTAYKHDTLMGMSECMRRFSHLWCIDTGLSRALHLVFPRGTGSLKNISSLPFIIWRTFFHHKEACVTQKGSSDVWRFVMEPFRQKTFFYGIVKHLYF